MVFKITCILCFVFLIFSLVYSVQDGDFIGGVIKLFFKEHTKKGEHSVIHARDIVTESPWVYVRVFGSIQDALDRCPAGGTVFLPAGSYLVSETIIVDHRVHLRGDGTIVVNDGSHLDRVVDIQASAAGTTLTGITIDQSNVTVSLGAGSGIFISANHCYLENVIVVGQGDVFNSPFEACFDIYGDHCVLFGCVAQEAAYAGFRCRGSKNTKIIGCESLEWRYKGFVVNGSASNIIIDSCIASTQHGASSGVSGVLVDTGNHNLDTIILSNIIVDGDYNGTGMKIAPAEGYVVSNAYITNLSIKASNLEDGLILNGITNCYVTNLSVTEEISVRRDVDFCQINGLISDVAGADNQNIDAQLDGTLIIRDIYLKGALIGGVRVENSSGNGKQVIIIDKVTLEGNDETVRMFRATDEPWPGRIKLVSFEVITGTTDLTGTNLKNAQIQRNLGLPRIFRDNQDPDSRGITNAYNIGDIVYDKSPSAGSKVGWICVPDDSPDSPDGQKWASFGAISVK